MAGDADFLLGADGGGSGTRVRLADAAGRELAQGHAGPSALSRGIEPAWRAIDAAIGDAFAQAGHRRAPPQRLALGLGIAGANHAPWLQALRETAPPWAAFEVDSDAYTTLLGAHGGEPGAVVAVGTGSVGMAEYPDGQRVMVGGWGFPVGDEGSGAWIGQRAVAHAEKVQDGRRADSPFARAVRAACGGDGVLAWVVGADASRFAALAPVVLDFAGRDAAAREIVVEAAAELGRIARALDPSGELPLAWCGGLAQPLMPHLAAELRRRSRAPRADAAAGALLLLGRRRGLPYAAAAAPLGDLRPCPR